MSLYLFLVWLVLLQCVSLWLKPILQKMSFISLSSISFIQNSIPMSSDNFEFYQNCFSCRFRDKCNEHNAEHFAALFEAASREQQDAILGLVDDLDLVFDFHYCIYEGCDTHITHLLCDTKGNSKIQKDVELISSPLVFTGVLFE